MENLYVVNLIRNVKFAFLILLVMKNILSFFLLINVLTLLFSCSSSNEFTLNSRVQKKRYSNGYTFCFSTNKKKINERSIKENQNTSLLNEVSENEINTDVASLNNSIEQVVNEQKLSNPIYKGNSIDKSPILIQYNIEKTKNKDLPKFDNQIINKENTELKFKNRSNLKTNFNKINDEKLLMIFLVVLSFILPPLSVLLYTNINWKKVLISTLLTCFFWVPGIIYSLLVILEIL